MVWIETRTCIPPVRQQTYASYGIRQSGGTRSGALLDTTVLRYLSPMYALRVAQKVVLLCNLCWVADIFLRMGPQAAPQGLWGAVGDGLRACLPLLGELAALPLSIALHLLILVLGILGRIRVRELSLVLLVINLVFIPLIILFRLR